MLILLVHCHHNSQCAVVNIVKFPLQETSDEKENYFFRVAEAIFVGWFSLEYTVRLLVAPHKFAFLTSFLNIIDLLGILPFFVSVGLNLLSSTYSLEYIAKAAQIFRILRILRIFKLSRHITGLKTLGTTLRNSHRYFYWNFIIFGRYLEGI